MKKLSLLLLGILLLKSPYISAQVPQKMSYQAVIRNTSNALIVNSSVGMRISIIQGSPSGTSVYVETQKPTTNANGLLSIEIGTGTTISGNFSTINWSNGPFFIRTETDPTGGANYSIIGTSQLLSVPYALHAKTADSITGTILEKDPIYEASVARGIKASDTALWNKDNDATNELQRFSVSKSGDTLYLSNGNWVIVPGISLANAPAGPLYPSGTVHCGSIPTAVVDVTNPTTGKTWMDRNLGASRLATSSTDTMAHGDLYQWGRRSDGHQCRKSDTTSILSSTDAPVHGKFIESTNFPLDWRITHNDNLWQGVNGINNPCPIGYRIPTETELNNERISWSTNNNSGAFASNLKLSMGGERVASFSVRGVGTSGCYWTSTTRTNGGVRYLFFDNSSANINNTFRAIGNSIRCIKN